MPYIGNKPTNVPLSSADLPDNIVTSAKIADDAVDSDQLASGAVDDAHLATGIASSKLSGALPALDASSLTSIPAGNITGTLPALNASSLTNLDARDLENALPAISGASLTNLPDQSATDVKFSACLSTSHDNVTGDGTGWWTNTSGVSWSTPIINTGSGFSGGLFTVPAGGAGTYLFSFHSWIGGILSTHTEAYGYFETSNRNYEAYHGSPYASYVVANTSQSFNWQTIADMDVGDTCKVKMGIYNGTKVCDMRGNGGFNYTSTVFQGVLLA